MALDPAVAAVRLAVRRTLLDSGEGPVLVACSGGADSLALLAATVFEARGGARRVVGVTVDHGLQAGSAAQADQVVAQIRRKFDRRRKGVGALDRVLRKLLGLDAKMAQYRNGAAFVRGVVDKVGMAEFNAVWDRPENLPTRAEIADPSAWVSRVL